MTDFGVKYCYATEQIVTPLVPVRLEDDGPSIWCKLEYHNPSGSTKDRIARFILGKAIRSGRLRPGDWVVEASSGSTSISLALMCAQFQLKFHAIMPCGVSPERIAILEAFGAEVELTDSPLGLRGAIDRARQFAADKPAMATDQFANPDNPAAHRYQTAAEILSQIPSRSVDAVVSGVGTGGTLVGLFEGFCDFGCAPLPVAARPICPQSAFELECSSFSSRIPGVADCLSTIFRDAALPGLRQLDIEDEIALTTTRRLLLAGFPVGPSSGLNYAAAVAIATELGEEASVVTIFPDRMERYLSTGLLAKAR